MPTGTRVHRCVDKLKKTKPIGSAIAICQSSTKQNFHNGRKLKSLSQIRKSIRQGEI